jgi:hypothetical protein
MITARNSAGEGRPLRASRLRSSTASPQQFNLLVRTQLVSVNHDDNTRWVGTSDEVMTDGWRQQCGRQQLILLPPSVTDIHLSLNSTATDHYSMYESRVPRSSIVGCPVLTAIAYASRPTDPQTTVPFRLVTRVIRWCTLPSDRAKHDECT